MAGFISRNMGLIPAALLYIIVNLAFFSNSMYWDSAVYLSMGKHIWSSGGIGLWEPARPVLWPVFLGFLWKLGLDAVLIGKLVSMAMGLLAVASVYFILKDTAKGSAVIFTALFALSGAVAENSSLLTVDIPSMALSLFAICLIIRKGMNFVPGIIIGLSAMTKFTHLIFIPILMAAIFLRRNQLKDSFLFFLGSFSALMPYLAINVFQHGNAFYSFIEGSRLISDVAAAYHSNAGNIFYINGIFFEFPLLALALIPLFSLRNWKHCLLAIALIVPLAYHSFFLDYKDMRYSTIFLPYLFILGGIGYAHLSRWKIKKVLVAFVIAQAAYSSYSLYSLHSSHYFGGALGLEKQIALIPEKLDIWSTNPYASALRDIRTTELMYYPVFNSEKMEYLYSKLDSIPDYVVVSACDIPCDNRDMECQEKSETFLSGFSQRLSIISENTENGCKTTIYSKNS